MERFEIRLPIAIFASLLRVKNAKSITSTYKIFQAIPADRKKLHLRETILQRPDNPANLVSSGELVGGWKKSSGDRRVD